jgi:phosphoglycolate phosphatase
MMTGRAFKIIMSKFSSIIFDMDGTLIDSGTAISSAINYVRDFYSLPPLEKNDLLKAMNDPDIHSPTYFYKTPEFTKKQMELFDEYYDENCVKQLELYDGIYELLVELKNKNVVMSVATNASSFYASKMLESVGIKNFFEIIVGADMVKNPKPSADMILYIQENSSIELSNTILIGDSLKDQYAAQNAGIDSILVNWGFSDHTDAINDINILHKNVLELL